MTLWGGRFTDPPAGVLWDYTVDQADRRLLSFDLEGSIAHVAMLAAVGLLDPNEHRQIEAGLTQIQEEAARGGFEFLPGDEDVHSAVERRLLELVGAVGEKLHTGRSRNDQIALDVRLYLRQAVSDRHFQLEALVSLLADLASAHADTIVASYTHLQPAQSISLGHHFLAYAWMAMRDRDRLADVGSRLDVSPLGAGASAGSSLPINPAATAAALGFAGHFENSLDAVGSRDLITEFVYCCCQAMVSLSRLAEDLVLWSTREFAWVTLADAYTTGSSALPHKKNPDVAELARGKSAGIIGDLTSLLVLQKGLPLSYNRDLQEDKPPLFRADDALAGTLTALGGMLATAEFHPPPPTPETTALDLAEALVGRGVAFRSAHEAVGRLVAALSDAGRSLGEATSIDLAQAGPHFVVDDLILIDPIASAHRRRTPGGGSPASVRHQIAKLREMIGSG